MRQEFREEKQPLLKILEEKEKSEKMCQQNEIEMLNQKLNIVFRFPLLILTSWLIDWRLYEQVPGRDKVIEREIECIAEWEELEEEEWEGELGDVLIYFCFMCLNAGRESIEKDIWEDSGVGEETWNSESDWGGRKADWRGE